MRCFLGASGKRPVTEIPCSVVKRTSKIPGQQQNIHAIRTNFSERAGGLYDEKKEQQWREMHFISQRLSYDSCARPYSQWSRKCIHPVYRRSLSIFSRYSSLNPRHHRQKDRVFWRLTHIDRSNSSFLDRATEEEKSMSLTFPRLFQFRPATRHVFMALVFCKWVDRLDDK